MWLLYSFFSVTYGTLTFAFTMFFPSFCSLYSRFYHVVCCSLLTASHFLSHCLSHFNAMSVSSLFLRFLSLFTVFYNPIIQFFTKSVYSRFLLLSHFTISVFFSEFIVLSRFLIFFFLILHFLSLLTGLPRPHLRIL